MLRLFYNVIKAWIKNEDFEGEAEITLELEDILVIIAGIFGAIFLFLL